MRRRCYRLRRALLCIMPTFVATDEISQNVTSAADGAKLVVTVLSEVANATTKTQQSAQTILNATESVEEVTANLRSEVESFLRRPYRLFGIL